MSPITQSLYVQCASQREQRLRKNKPPQEGGLAEASWLAPSASASFRTYPFLSERHKFDSPQLGEPVARDVVRRRWNRTTHDMHDLRGQTEDVLPEEHRLGVPGGELMNRCIKTPRWSGVVKGRKNSVDHEKRQTVPGKSEMVRRSTPISYCRASRQEKRQKQICSIEYRCGITLDRLTTAAFRRRSGAVSLVNPSNRSVDHPDHCSGEVTL